MTRLIKFLDHRIPLGAALMPLCVFLSACGGGGGGDSHVASIPPPPSTPSSPTLPAPQSTTPPLAQAHPLTRVGSYDPIGLVITAAKDLPATTHVVQPGEFSVDVSSSSAGFGYQLTGPADFLPNGPEAIDYGTSASWSTNGNGHTRGSSYRLVNFSPDRNVQTSLNVDPGLSYVSMGEWQWHFVHLDGGTAGGYGRLLFVIGDRTPESSIPATGTATYNAHTLSLLSPSLSAGIPFTLTADFGQRTISTQIDQDYRYNPHGDLLDYPAPGIHVSGSTVFSNGGQFNIPLSGTANFSLGYDINTPQTPATLPVTGTMNGAFFGPNAAQVGGTFSLAPPGGPVLLSDAFVGQRP